MSSNKVTVPYHLADLSTVHLELVYLVSCTHFGLLPALTSDYFLHSLRTTSCTHFGLLPALTSDYVLPSLRTTSCTHFGLLPALTSDYVLPSLRTTSCPHFGLLPALTSDYFLHLILHACISYTLYGSTTLFPHPAKWCTHASSLLFNPLHLPPPPPLPLLLPPHPHMRGGREEHLQAPDFLPVLRIVERAYSQIYGEKGKVSVSGEKVAPRDQLALYCQGQVRLGY